MGSLFEISRPIAGVLTRRESHRWLEAEAGKTCLEENVL